MTAQQLEQLGDGLSISAGGRTLTLDRTRVREAAGGHDVSFVIAGTDLAPRVHLGPSRLAAGTWEEMSSLLRRVAVRAAGGGRID